MVGQNYSERKVGHGACFRVNKLLFPAELSLIGILVQL